MDKTTGQIGVSLVPYLFSTLQVGDARLSHANVLAHCNRTLFKAKITTQDFNEA